jgi:hypothetical protein
MSILEKPALSSPSHKLEERQALNCGTALRPLAKALIELAIQVLDQQQLDSEREEKIA